jgi:hypothetical protein
LPPSAGRPAARAANQSASPSFSESRRHLDVAAHADHATVEADGREREEAGELRVEDRRVVHRDLDAPPRPQAEQVVELVVAVFEGRDRVAFEALRSVRAGAPVDRDVLAQQEVRRTALLEVAVGPRVPRRAG